MGGTKLTRTQRELLIKNGRFPDDFLYIGMKTEQDDYKNQKGNKKSLDKSGIKTRKMIFKNKSEGFTIELNVN